MKNLAMSVVVRLNKVLVQRRYRRDKGMVYEFPGGSIDAGETGEQAAIRELWEETGLQGLLAHGTYRATNEFGGEIHYVLLEVRSEDEPQVIDPVRQQTFHWFEYNEIPLCDFFPADIEFIERDLRPYLEREAIGS